MMPLCLHMSFSFSNSVGLGVTTALALWATEAGTSLFAPADWIRGGSLCWAKPVAFVYRAFSSPAPFRVLELKLEKPGSVSCRLN